jgi:hypothetical protein
MVEAHTLLLSMKLSENQNRDKSGERTQNSEEVELTSAQLGGLVHYFGIDSAETPESLLEGVDALAKLQRL